MEYGIGMSTKSPYPEHDEKRASKLDSPKESPTHHELTILSKEIAEITIMSEELMRRLIPVLTSQPEIAENMNKTPQESLSEMQESLSEIPSEIRRNRESLAHPAYNLKSILSRLEI